MASKPKIGGARTSAIIQAEIMDRDRARTDAQRSLDRLMAERPNVLRYGSEAELKALDEQQRTHLTEVERQGLLIGDLRTELLGIEREAEQGKRTKSYAQAKAMADKAAAQITDTYPGIVRDLTSMLRDLAQAQLAVLAVNVALPDGAQPIDDPEHTARAVPGLAREVVKSEEVERWTRLDQAQPVPEEYQDEIAEVKDGWGRRDDDEEPSFLLARYRRTEYRDPTYADIPLPLATSLALPAVRGSGLAWGEAFDFGGVHPALVAAARGGGHPQVVLERLATNGDLSIPPPVLRPTKVEWELLGYVGAAPLKAIPPNAYSRQDLRGQNEDALLGSSERVWKDVPPKPITDTAASLLPHAPLPAVAMPRPQRSASRR